MKQRGFTIVELLVVTIIIGILVTLSVVAYKGIDKRAKNAATLHSVQETIKALEIYKQRYGTYPLQRYTNLKYANIEAPKSGPLLYIFDDTSRASVLRLILNNPNTLRTLAKRTALYSEFTQEHTEPQKRGFLPSSLYYRKSYFDNTTDTSISRAGKGLHTTADWEEYADYLEKLFKGVPLPEVYNDNNRFSITKSNAYSGKERVAMGLTYHIAYHDESGERRVFLTYGTWGKESCGQKVHRQTYSETDDITVCTLKVSQENIGAGIDGN